MVYATTAEGKPVKVNIHPVAQLVIGVALTLLSGVGVWMTNSLMDLETRTTALEVTQDLQSQSSFITVREFEQATRIQEAALARMEAKLDQLQQHLMETSDDQQ